MKRFQHFFRYLAVLAIASACNSAPVEQNPLLEYIPSDASAIVCSDRMDSGIQTVFGPDNVLRDLSLGTLADEPVVFSFHYSGTLIPLLAVAHGRPSQQMPQALASLAHQADSLGLMSTYIPAESKSGKKNVLLLCESESLLGEARIHVEQGASILDAPGIGEALSHAAPSGQTIIMRNDAAYQFLDQNFLSSYMRRRDLMNFIGGFSTWTVLNLEKTEVFGRGETDTYAVTPVCDEGMEHYFNVLDGFQPAVSQLSGMLPYGTTCAIDMPVASVGAVVAARKKFLDATGGLNRFNMFCKSHHSASGADPVKWAEESDVKEVAKISCRGEEVLLVRLGHAPEEEGMVQNDWAGFPSALFGKAFATADESWRAEEGHWTVIGSEKAVKHYLLRARKSARTDWKVSSAKAAMFADDVTITWDASGLKFEVYKTY